MHRKNQTTLPAESPEIPAETAEPITYFVAICRYKNNAHNCTMVGSSAGACGYKVDYAVGKQFTLESNGNLGCSAFGCIPANLFNEPLQYSHRSYDIHYQAYEITADQYNHFKNNYVVTDYTHGSRRKEVDFRNADNNTFNHISINNTCRHAAIDIMKCTGIEMPKISKSYLSKLHNEATVSQQRIITEFFVLPVKPNLLMKQNEPLRYVILCDLHQAMTRLAKTRFGKELAAKKVDALRGLYNRIRATENISPAAIQQLIAEWGKEKSTDDTSNLYLINEKRSTRFSSIFSHCKATTAKAVDKLTARLERIARISV